MRNKDDERLRMRLENKLGNQGLRAPCRLSVEVYQNTVTLTGTVMYEYQKRAAIQISRSMDGIRGVIDRIQVAPPIKRWDDDAPAHQRTSGESEPVAEPVEAPEQPAEGGNPPG